MKKTYLTPKAVVVELDTELLMAGSDGINLSGGSNGGNGVDDGTETDARDRSTNGLFDWN